MRWTPRCDSSDTTAGLAARLSTAAPPPGHARRRGSLIGPRPRRLRAGIAPAARRRRAADSDVARARPASVLGSWSRPLRASRASEREEGNVYTTVCVSQRERGGGRRSEKLEGRRQSLGQTCLCAEPRWPELRWWRRGAPACRPPSGSHSGEDLSSRQGARRPTPCLAHCSLPRRPQFSGPSTAPALREAVGMLYSRSLVP